MWTQRKTFSHFRWSLMEFVKSLAQLWLESLSIKMMDSDAFEDVCCCSGPGSELNICLDLASVSTHLTTLTVCPTELQWHSCLPVRDAEPEPEPEPEPPEPTHFGRSRSRSRSRRNGFLGAGAGAGAVKRRAAPAPKRDEICGKITEC